MHTTRTHICTQHTHSCVIVCQGNGTKEKVFKKRKVFKEDLKDLTNRGLLDTPIC